MSSLRLATLTTRWALTRSWTLAVILLLTLSAWSNSRDRTITAPDNELIPLQPSLWDALQLTMSNPWTILYVMSLPCALYGVALTAGARSAGWSALMAPRAGGIRHYLLANLLAAILLTTTLFVALTIITCVIALLRGGALDGIGDSELAALTLKNAEERRYTMVSRLGLTGSLALAASTSFCVAFTSQLIGQYIGTLCRRVPIAVGLSIIILVFIARVVRSALPYALEVRTDLPTRSNLANYLGSGDPGTGISIAWAYITPTALTLLLIIAIWQITLHRGITRIDT